MSTPSSSTSPSSSTVVGEEDITTSTQKKKQKLEEDEKELTEEDLNQQRQWLFDTMLKISLNNNIKLKEVDLALLLKLELPNCGITTLPDCLPTVCPNLSILFCPKNKFVEVPALIGQCLKLQMISFKECYTIQTIHPNSLQQQLRWLILTGNKIKVIPKTISRCIKLQKLMLSGNLLEELPEQEMINLQNLELIRLSCNQLQQPPILFLTKLKNLKWCAFAGNPFLITMKMKTAVTTTSTTSTKEEEQQLLPSLPILEDPILEDDSWPILGMGAGGVTRKVTWKNNTVVAVKTFAGELTSDGSPQDEKDISILVSSSASSSSSTKNENEKESALIEILGETKMNGALVMEYLDNYTALAGPPNFETCSRDVYSDIANNNNSMNNNKTFAWKIVIDTLRVLSKLHNLGICHADFYAHNILIQLETNQVKLSDFGAAFRYRYNDANDGNDDTNDNENENRKEFGQLVEIIELRAYGVLVTELHHLTMIGDNGNDNDNDTSNNHSPQWKELLEELQKPNTTTFDILVEKFIVNVNVKQN
jgi:Leucine-rich repeat (LRR) protein